MFLNCINLRNLDVSNFNTTNALIIKGMFKNCNSLKYLNLSNFSTVNVEDMSYLLCDCYELLKADLSSFDLSNVVNTVKIFCGCTSLKKIIVSNKWNMSEMYEDDYMFDGCEKLSNYDKDRTGAEMAKSIEQGDYLTLV